MYICSPIMLATPGNSITPVTYDLNYSKEVLGHAHHFHLQCQRFRNTLQSLQLCEVERMVVRRAVRLPLLPYCAI